MDFSYPLTRYRPTRAPDGAGGYTETLANAITIYGALHIHADKVTAIIDALEDVQVGDVLGVNESGAEVRYRITHTERMLTTIFRKLSLQKIDRPIG